MDIFHMSRRVCRVAVLLFPAMVSLWGSLTFAEDGFEALPQASYEEGDFQAGIAVYLVNSDYTDLKDLGQKLDSLFTRLIGIHVNSVSLAWPVYTEGVSSNLIFRGERTPADDALLLFMEKAIARGFFVVLHPIINEEVLMAQGHWRGTIRPSNSDAWFKSYTDIMLEYAALAQQARVNAFAVATELVSMEKHTTRWRSMIEKVRENFSGQLTYSSNQGVAPAMPWDALDIVGIDAFFELESPEDATVEQMIAAWQKWIPEIRRRDQEIGKPFIFSEIGVASQRGAHQKSWLWSHNTPVDLENQRRFYAAVCAVWKDKLDGIYWWNTTIWMLDDPANDKSFMALGKPAEQEIANCFRP